MQGLFSRALRLAVVLLPGAVGCGLEPDARAAVAGSAQGSAAFAGAEAEPAVAETAATVAGNGAVSTVSAQGAAPPIAARVRVYGARDAAPVDGEVSMLAPEGVSVTTTLAAGAIDMGSMPGGASQWLMTFSAPGFETLRVVRTAGGGGGGLQTPGVYAADTDPIYMCPVGSLDSDGDSICDDAEVRYATSAVAADSDGDALSDDAELYGTFPGGVTYDIKALGASPQHKDVFVEIDYMPGHKPMDGVKELVEQAFANSSVKDNPDGRPGIHLYIEIGQVLTEKESVDVITSWDEIYAIKKENLVPGRHPAFHYGIFAKQYKSTSNYSSGLSEGNSASSNFMVTLGGWTFKDDAAKRMTQAGTLMHELGHNLGLFHSGFLHDGSGGERASNDINYMPHYLSVMNYTYQQGGLTIDGTKKLDFARFPVLGISELSFDEVSAFAPDSGATEADLARYTQLQLCRNQKNERMTRPLIGTASADLDLNHNGRVDRRLVTRQPKPLRRDLDGNGAIEVLSAIRDDWTRLVYTGIVSPPVQTTGRAVSEHEGCMTPPNPELEEPMEDPTEQDDPTIPPGEEPTTPPPTTPPTEPQQPQYPEEPQPEYPQEPEPQYPQEPEPEYPPQEPEPEYPQEPEPEYPQEPLPEYPQEPEPEYPQEPEPEYPQEPEPEYPQEPEPEYPQEPEPEYPQEPEPEYPQEPEPEYPEDPEQP